MYIIIFEVPDSLLKSFHDFFFVEFSKHLQYIFFFGEIIITVELGATNNKS